jgi:hypothetical protein
LTVTSLCLHRISLMGPISMLVLAQSNLSCYSAWRYLKS